MVTKGLTENILLHQTPVFWRVIYIVIYHISSPHAWLVDEEVVYILATNNQSQNLERFMKIFITKIYFQGKTARIMKFPTTEIWSYMVGSVPVISVYPRLG